MMFSHRFSLNKTARSTREGSQCSLFSLVDGARKHPPQQTLGRTTLVEIVANRTAGLAPFDQRKTI